MPSFTSKLRTVVDYFDGTLSVVNGQRVLTGAPNLGLNEYPIFKSDHRPVLNGLIIDHYFNQEIGVESPDLFALALRRKMNEIMPYYNKLYNSELIEFDPLSTVNVKNVSTANTVNESEAQSTIENANKTISGARTVQSDTPQNMLSGNADYASGAVDANSEANTDATANETNNANNTTEQTGESTTNGYQGVASQLLMSYRAALLNIDMMVVNELSDLFMLIWDNQDARPHDRRFSV